MHFDVCCCTYNSAKWLKGFFEAMTAVDYDKKCLHLYFTDNCSTDDTIDELESYQKSLKDIFGDFEIIKSKTNSGFGTASNTSARAGKSEYVFFYNVDTAIHKNAFCELKQAILKADKTTGAFELRQFPFEHPKYYDPVTLKTDWASGAALVLTRKVFDLIGGFDESIFMYCEDVDLSWRIRMEGYDIQYVPSAVTDHFTADDISVMKSSQMAGQLAGEKILRLKFGTKGDIKGWDFYKNAFAPRLAKDKKARELADRLLKQIDKNKSSYRRFYRQKVKHSEFEPDFVSGYTFFRSGATYINQLPTKTPDISVIIRTYNRPNVLKITLENLLNQTYKNFRVLVVEDGETPVSENVVASFANQLNIEYFPLKRRAGRCEAGNIGLSNVKTQYVCFLDDDDYLFADYMEVNAKLIEDNPNCKMFCSSSIVAKTKKLNQDGSDFEFVEKINMVAKDLSIVNFCFGNPVAIQSVVFDVELFQKYGGFDLELDAFEDWDLWLRYLTNCDVVSTDKTLSLFKVPATRKDSIARNKAMENYRVRIFEKLAQYSTTITAQDIYKLFWTPDNLVDYDKDEFEDLQKSSQEIQNSNVWKIAQPFRFVCIGLQIFFYKLYMGIQSVLGFFGPKAPEEDCEDYGLIQNFVMQTQESNYMKLFRAITGNRSKK